MTAIVIHDPADRARFDHATETWTVTSADGRCDTAAVVIDARRSDDNTVAVHGVPNYFRIPGPDIERQTRLVQRCLDMFERSGAARIEARSRVTARRWPPIPLTHRFHLSGATPSEEDVYDGPVTVSLPGGDVTGRARLSGHLEAVDGRFHWRGTISGELPLDLLTGARTVTLSTPGHRAAARITERTPWGSYTVTGTDAPPYPLS
ncbi:MAG: DUF4873 domain-containing protein [Mycobacterium sp.]